MLLNALRAPPKVIFYITNGTVYWLENIVKICTNQDQYIYASETILNI